MWPSGNDTPGVQKVLSSNRAEPVFLFSSLLFFFSFTSVFVLVIIAVFFCFFIYCIYLAISQVIFTQIKAKVQ